ncbi:MAG TPA: hypothetical protein ENI92_08305, partial [Bacteroidetes bacterium]|nr:hypothetical protein [Bacteroidota bacterium]
MARGLLIGCAKNYNNGDLLRMKGKGKMDKIIGIDLGTTNSVVAVMEGGE